MGDERPPHSGGAGAPPGGIMTSREELADRGRTLRRGNLGPAPKRRRDGAPRGVAPSQEGAHI